MKLLLYLLPLLFLQQTGQLATARISGQIRDTSGKPASGIRVFAIPVQTDIIDARSATELINNISLTDSNGRYTLEDVLPGRYLIAAGSVASPAYYPGVPDVKQGRIVAMVAGQPVANLDFTFDFPVKSNELWGTAVLDEGTPLSTGLSRQLQFIVSTPKTYWLADPFTLQQGIFFFSGLGLEELTFSVAPLPLGYYLKSATYGNVDLTKARLNLTRGFDGTDIQVVLTKTRPPGTPAGVRVSGRISGWKPGMAAVQLHALATVLGRATTVSTMVAAISPRDDGSFEVPEVPPGLYTLQSASSKISHTASFEVTGADVVNLDLMFDQSILVPLRTNVATPIKISVNAGDLGDGTSPAFELRFTAVRTNASGPHSVKVSSKELSALVPEGEYLASVSGLPPGYAVASVTAGPYDLSEPFLLTGQGIVDRFTGKPILNRPIGGGPATPEGITIKLRASP